MLKVAAHLLDANDAEEEQEFIEDRLADAPALVQKRPANVGPFFNESLRLLGFRASLQRAPQEIVGALAMARDFGVGLFARGSIAGTETVTLSVYGESVQIPGGPTIYNTAPRWLEAFGVCSVLRDSTALESLMRYEPTNFEGVGDYAEHHVLFASALRAMYLGEGDVLERLVSAKRSAEAAKVLPERARKVDVPLIELAGVIHQQDQGRFSSVLAGALDGYRELSARKSQAQLAELFVPIVHLGLCARAHDLGMRLEVESSYLPAWLVSGAFTRP